MTDLVLLDLLRVELAAVVSGRDSPVAPVGDGGGDVVGGQGRVLANAVGDDLRKELVLNTRNLWNLLSCHMCILLRTVSLVCVSVV